MESKSSKWIFLSPKFASLEQILSKGHSTEETTCEELAITVTLAVNEYITAVPEREGPGQSLFLVEEITNTFTSAIITTKEHC